MVGFKIVQVSKNERLLGINIQNNLSWQAQIETGDKVVFPATRKTFGALSHIKDMMIEIQDKYWQTV